jgi:hypothetical protein
MRPSPQMQYDRSEDVRMARDGVFTRLRRARRHPEAGGPLCALHQELLEICRLVCVVGSILNDQRRAGELSVQSWSSALPMYLPASPALFPTLASELLKSGACLNAIMSLQSFFARLSFACNVVHAGCCPNLCASDPPVLPRGVMADVWRRLAGHGLLTVYELRAAMVDLGISMNDDLQGRMEQLLGAVRDGGSPIHFDGTIAIVPGWLDRRNASRSVCGRRITIWVDGTARSALLADISNTGAGLRDCGTLVAGSSIVIEPMSGRSVPGRVAWARSGGIGLVFNEPLAPDDPLLV